MAKIIVQMAQILGIIAHIGIWIILCGDCYHPLCSTEDVNKTFNFIYEILTELTSYNVA